MDSKQIVNVVAGKKMVLAKKPKLEILVQSPYLYLQSTGSDGTDGTAKGFHLRWDYLRNLGDTHIPKGDMASTTVNFNRKKDFVYLFRSPYIKRFPTVIDFTAQAPDFVHDSLQLWIYNNTNTNTTVYIHFRRKSLYDRARAAANPKTDTPRFVELYGNGLIEVEVKDKLCFAAELGVKRHNNAPVIRAEAISVVENLPLTERFVSCRMKFDNENWCGEKTVSVRADNNTAMSQVPKYVPACCKSRTNLINNGDFENGFENFETSYLKEGEQSPGIIWITSDAASISQEWKGLPHTGKKFLAVDGAVNSKQIVWKQTIKVKPGNTYCFSSAIASLTGRSPASVEIILKSEERTDKHIVHAPEQINEWQTFAFSWFASKAEEVDIWIIDLNEEKDGNDFALDSLWLCEQAACKQRIVSENIRSIRFDVNGGYVQRIELETYENYMTGAGNWTKLKDNYSLNKDTNIVVGEWLENAASPVNNSWSKFNDGAKVNIKNYKDRWLRPNGIREGVLSYVNLSNTDPLAISILPGDNPVDGSIEVSYLDMLKLVALDFHAARMLGQGTIDIAEDYDGEYLHVAVYVTEGLLDIHTEPLLTEHIYMSVPTNRRDFRLPDVPVLKPLRYGLFVNNGQVNPSPLTDANGYTPAGTSRFISLFMEQEDADPVLGNFFTPAELLRAIDKTNSVFFGIEYRKTGKPDWEKPEIAHDATYTDTSNPAFAETSPIPNSGDEDKVVLVHQEHNKGFHEYAPYGINWFSRASGVGNIRQTDETKFPKANTLLPPSNFQAQLIQEESPLLLTTATEQANLADPAILPGTDKTYIRLTFDYFHTHDLAYQFGDQVELFFRQEAPGNVAGAVKSVTDSATDEKICIIRTKSYLSSSNGETITPVLAVAFMPQFIGGIFTSDGRNYIVKDIEASTVPGEGPVFTIKKIVENTAVSPGEGSDFITAETLIAPEVNVPFMSIENMADINSWGTHNPLSTTIELSHPALLPITETFDEEGTTITRELRGVWGQADITDVPDAGTGNIIGVYRIQFQTAQLPNHTQAGDMNPVNWHKGVARIGKGSLPGGPKKTLEIIKIEELGTGQPLRIFAVDTSYDAADPIQTGNNINVNYYPGYRAYLLADPANHLDAAHILPAAGEGHKITWIGARSKDSSENFESGIGTPAPLIALEFIEPIPPESPTGGEYATRPDFYYKSTYTFTVQFAHEPFAVVFYRATEDSILRALYKDSTVNTIKEQLKLLGDDDPYHSDRWKNLLSFDYAYNDPSKPYYDATGSNANGTFRRFPREAGNYCFPKPDRNGVFTGAQEPGVVLNKVKEVIYSIFTPLTEQPLLFKYIKGGSYQPVPKPQTIRDQNGVLLNPADTAFDQAPMAKKINNTKLQFTDFTLDGSSNMFYFYLAREIGNRGKMSDPSPIAGPVYLINTRPADAPAIKKAYTVPKGSGTEKPSIEFEINGYPEEQKIGKMEIYRTTDAASALTIRAMQKVKTTDLITLGMVNSMNYKLQDNFEDGFVPYGDPLYYRMVALRQVKNANGDIEWAPSLPSKLLITTIIDTENPPVPQPRFTSSPISGSPARVSNVTITWDTTVHNGTYYLEKMNSAGNWNTIYRIKSNSATVTVNLATELLINVLPKQDNDGAVIYNRFRVRVENSAGLFGLEEKVLTI